MAKVKNPGLESSVKSLHIGLQGTRDRLYQAFSQINMTFGIYTYTGLPPGNWVKQSYCTNRCEATPRGICIQLDQNWLGQTIASLWNAWKSSKIQTDESNHTKIGPSDSWLVIRWPSPSNQDYIHNQFRSTPLKVRGKKAALDEIK